MTPQTNPSNNPLQQESTHNEISGVLLVNKPRDKTSFSLVGVLRRLLKVQKIGHAGTLDPFATGVMVMLIGKKYTRLSDSFLCADKEYVAQVYLGIETDSYDSDGIITNQSPLIPTLEQVQEALKSFTGEIDQVPPMFSAKKQGGKKLYELARKGICVERPAVRVMLTTQLLDYAYPYISLRIQCSKGTYIRSIAHDVGQLIGCGAHLSELQRTRSGSFLLEHCIDGSLLFQPGCPVETVLQALKSSQ
jgi:tRNA pseudouridine55 synthase